jgi:hypothetical protein
MSVHVYVGAVPDQPDYGKTTIIITMDDANRYDFLKSCEQYFQDEGRSQDADQFEQASRQTTS